MRLEQNCNSKSRMLASQQPISDFQRHALEACSPNIIEPGHARYAMVAGNGADLQSKILDRRILQCESLRHRLVCSSGFAKPADRRAFELPFPDLADVGADENPNRYSVSILP